MSAVPRFLSMPRHPSCNQAHVPRRTPRFHVSGAATSKRALAHLVSKFEVLHATSSAAGSIAESEDVLLPGPKDKIMADLGGNLKPAPSLSSSKSTTSLVPAVKVAGKELSASVPGQISFSSALVRHPSPKDSGPSEGPFSMVAERKKFFEKGKPGNDLETSKFSPDKQISNTSKIPYASNRQAVSAGSSSPLYRSNQSIPQKSPSKSLGRHRFSQCFPFSRTCPSLSDNPLAQSSSRLLSESSSAATNDEASLEGTVERSPGRSTHFRESRDKSTSLALRGLQPTPVPKASFQSRNGAPIQQALVDSSEKGDVAGNSAVSSENRHNTIHNVLGRNLQFSTHPGSIISQSPTILGLHTNIESPSSERSSLLSAQRTRQGPTPADSRPRATGGKLQRSTLPTPVGYPPKYSRLCEWEATGYEEPHEEQTHSAASAIGRTAQLQNMIGIFESLSQQSAADEKPLSADLSDVLRHESGDSYEESRSQERGIGLRSTFKKYSGPWSRNRLARGTSRHSNEFYTKLDTDNVTSKVSSPHLNKVEKQTAGMLQEDSSQAYWVGLVSTEANDDDAIPDTTLLPLKPSLTYCWDETICQNANMRTPQYNTNGPANGDQLGGDSHGENIQATTNTDAGKVKKADDSSSDHETHKQRRSRRVSSRRWISRSSSIMMSRVQCALEQPQPVKAQQLISLYRDKVRGRKGSSVAK